MAKVDILYHCGCGFRTHDQTQAEQHCDESFHDLSVSGIIHSSTRPPNWGQISHQQKRTRTFTASTKQSTTPEPQAAKVDTASYDRLRDMLRRSQ